MSTEPKISRAILSLSATLRCAGINADQVELVLPIDEWWKLAKAVDKELGGELVYDGCSGARSFRLAGVTVRPEQPAAKQSTAA